MALQTDTISINLAAGVNNKVDDKIAGPEQSSVLVDCRFDKDKRLKKRYGLTSQSQSFQGDPGFINPVAFGTSGLKTKCFEHEDQLCVINNGNLFSQYQAQSKWIFKGTCPSIGMSATQLNSNISFVDVAVVNGVSVAIGGLGSNNYVYVTEEATGNLIASTAVAAPEAFLKVIGFSTSAYILTGDMTNNNLYYRSVNLTTGVVGARTVIVANYVGPVTSLPSVTVTTSSSAIGEAALILYQDNAAGNLKAIPFLANGTTSALGIKTTGLTTAGSLVANIYMEPSVSANKFYVVGMANDAGRVEAYTFTSSVYTTVYSTTFGATTTSTNKNLNMGLSPINSTDLYIFFDSKALDEGLIGGFTGYNQSFSDDATVSMVQVSSTGTINFNSVYGYGYFVGAQCIRETTRKTIYLPCVYYSPLQTTFLLMNMLEGSASKFNCVIGKTLYGGATAPATGAAPRTSVSATNKYRTTNHGYFIDIDLAPTNGAMTKYFARTTHVTGGILWAYDGLTLAEHNFLIHPENFKAAAAGVGLSIVINTVGDASHKERFTATFRPAQEFRATSLSGGTQNYYFFFTTTTGAYYCWYKVDGSGLNPLLGGRTGIEVDLVGTDTDEDVAYKTAAAVNALGIDINATQFQNTIIFQNSFNGAVTAPDVGGNGVGGSLSAGSYQYTFVYKWTDRNGYVYRSAPAVPKTTVATLNQAATINIWAPPITNRTVTDIAVEIYRTQADQTEFQLVTTLSMSASTPRLVFLDRVPDSTLASNAILYTNGGVLENFGIGACKSLSTYKNRLLVGGVDDKTKVYYSRTNIVGEPVNFSAFNAQSFLDDGTGVTGHGEMDDKLVTWKGSAIFIQGGDGSNDLGQGSTFSLPMKIATDVGLTNPNSVVLYPQGIMFRSNKGIYELNRSLQVSYIGAPVEDYNSYSISSGVLMKSLNEIRFTLSDTARALVYNYVFGRWDFFSNHQSDSACLWQGSYVRASSEGKVWVEGTNFYDTDGTAQPYGMYLESVWLKIRNVQDLARIRKLSLLGEYKSAHTLSINVAYDYDPIAGNSDNYSFDATTAIGGGGTRPGDQTYQFDIGLKRQKCEAMKIKITEVPGTGTQESLIFNDLSAEVAIKGGLYRSKAAKSI